MLAGKLRAGHARPLQSGILNGYLLLARAVVALAAPVAVTLKPDGVLRQLGVKALGDLNRIVGVLVSHIRIEDKKLSADVGIPADLKGILKEEDIQFLAESAFADACCPGNPRDTSVEEIKELYRSLM